jgi:hypothetical protein
LFPVVSRDGEQLTLAVSWRVHHYLIRQHKVDLRHALVMRERLGQLTSLRFEKTLRQGRLGRKERLLCFPFFPQWIVYTFHGFPQTR